MDACRIEIRDRETSPFAAVSGLKASVCCPAPRYLLAGGIGGDAAFDKGGGDPAGYARPDFT